MYANSKIKRVYEINEFRYPFCFAFANPFPKAIIISLTSLTMQKENCLYEEKSVRRHYDNDSNYCKKDCSTYSVIYCHA